MVALIFLFFLNLAASLFKPKSRLEAENAALRRLRYDEETVGQNAVMHNTAFPMMW
jgi:cbb3-type cytochrome oxidase subunit 3